jgi:hypothetical protein
MSKRSILLAVVALLAIPIVTLGARATASSSISASQQDPCEGLEVVDTEPLICTHGGDPPEAFDTNPESTSSSLDQSAALASPVAPCPDGGVSGKRVEVIYAVPQDRTNNFAASLPSVLAAVNDADFFLDQSTPAVGGQHYRWLCENGSDVTVRNVTLVAVGADGQFTYGDMVTSLQNQVSSGLGPTDFVSADRAYLVFVDELGSAYPFGGQGDIRNDDSSDPGTNLNQTGPHYSLVNGFSGFVAEHELGHNIGAVQLSAPHSSGAWHCFEENDAMCYSDGGSYFTAGGALVFNCPTLPDTQFDCGQDDYYSMPSAAGTYLASHWNVSNSAFLTPFETPSLLDHFKCYETRQVGTKFDPRQVILTDQFNEERVTVVRPQAVCTPTDKDGSGINDPDAHLTCYKIRDVRRDEFPPFKKQHVEMADQFGTHTLLLRKTGTLCVPSSKTVL